MPYVWWSAVFIVGQWFRNHSDSSWRISFVVYLIDLYRILILSCSFLDRPCDIVSRDIVFLRFLYGIIKARIFAGISSFLSSKANELRMYREYFSFQGIGNWFLSFYNWTSSHNYCVIDLIKKVRVFYSIIFFCKADFKISPYIWQNRRIMVKL